MSGFSLFGGRKKARIAAIRTELGSVGRQLSAESRALDACEREVRDLQGQLSESERVEALLDKQVSASDREALDEIERSWSEVTISGLRNAYRTASEGATLASRAYAASGSSDDSLRWQIDQQSNDMSRYEGALAVFAQRSSDDVREHAGWLRWRVSEEGKKRAHHQSEVSRLRERQQALSAELQQLETR